MVARESKPGYLNYQQDGYHIILSQDSRPVLLYVNMIDAIAVKAQMATNVSVLDTRKIVEQRFEFP